MSVLDSDIFDVKLFRQLPLYIRIDVLKGRPLHSRGISCIYEIAYEAISEYGEFVTLGIVKYGMCKRLEYVI